MIKFENDDNRYWAFVTMCCAAIAICMIISITTCSVLQTRWFIEKGYTRKSIPGSEYTQWVLPEKGGE